MKTKEHHFQYYSNRPDFYEKQTKLFCVTSDLLKLRQILLKVSKLNFYCD